MADKRTQRRYLTRLGGGVIGLLLILGFVWFVRTMMTSKTGKTERQVQIVQVIRPPPPPPPDQPPPPPPPEKVEEPLPKDQPEAKPDEEPPPAEPLGLDAQGAAGEDAFGLAARHGGSDLVGGTGGAAFAWYTNRLKDAVLDKLAAEACTKSQKLSASVRIWLEPDGRVREAKLATTTGNRALDTCIQGALASLPHFNEAPPLEMPQADYFEDYVPHIRPMTKGIRKMRMCAGKLLQVLMTSLALAAAPLTAAVAADERQSMEELRNTVINLLQALVDQGVMSREKAAQLVKAAQDKAAADAASVAKADEGAVRVPYVPQIVKDDIAKQVADQVKPAVVADVVKEAKTEKWGVPGALADWLTRTRLSGSVTLREEDVRFASDNVQNFYLNYYAINTAGGFAKAGLNAFENVDVDRLRFRGRARLAVDSDITDSISAGMRIATGNTSDLVSESQTLDGTAPYQFGLDELFIRLDERNAQKFPWLSVVGGRFLNPYGTPTDLIFHKDLTFEGAALTGRFGLGDGTADQSHVFVTVGAHPLQEIALSVQDKWLAGGQVGANIRWGEGQRLRLSGAFYDYFNVTGELNPINGTVYNYTAPTFERQGNTYFDISNSTDTTVNLFALAAKYRLANLNVTYELPIGRYTLGVTADAVKNLGYNTARVSANVGEYVAPRTKGYQGEFSFGHPTVLTAGAWRGVIGYRYLQRDAVIDAYTDSDFHWGGTDARGYYLVGDYGVADRVWVRLRYLSSNAIDGPTLGIDTLQLDLNTRF